MAHLLSGRYRGRYQAAAVWPLVALRTKREPASLGGGCWLSALSVWLVAQYHFQLYHVDPDLLFALGAIEREIY